eukprot:scaffold53801_cov30-Prasinocladus_malaysianus.AAC.1
MPQRGWFVVCTVVWLVLPNNSERLPVRWDSAMCVTETQTHSRTLLALVDGASGQKDLHMNHSYRSSANTNKFR